MILSLRRRMNEPVLANSLFMLGMINILWQMVAGKRFDEHDTDIVQILQERL